jgi:hypothetical protein
MERMNIHSRNEYPGDKGELLYGKNKEGDDRTP